MRTHVTVLAAIYIALGSIGVLIALIVVVSVAGGGLISGDPEAIAITSIVGVSIAACFAVIAAPAIIAGVGLYRRRPWARLVALVLGCLLLLAIPFGTLIGVYTIWVLTRPETSQFLSSDFPA